MSATEPEHREVVVVGAGFGGIAAAVRLLGRGHDVLVLEAADDVGGTWRDNTYPGAACDVPSALYSFSFAPEPGWTRHYARQPEILDYLRRVAGRFGVTPHVRFRTRLERADWDDAARRWRLTTSGGPVEARWLVAACGPLHEPALPELPGLADFRGEVFHSARWDHDHDLRGRRVAVLGTGASAVQLVPEVAEQVEHLVVLQRTPQWVLPRFDRDVPRAERALYRRVPLVQRLVRLAVYLGAEAVAAGARRPRTLRPLAWAARRHLRRQVRDPGLRARLAPPDHIGCKRLLVSNDWYPTLTRPHVTVADGRVRELRAGSVVDGDGVEHAIDTLVLATGFHAAEPPVARLLHDDGGVSLAGRWAGEGPRAHLGTTVAGFPNLFLLAGPNSFVYSSIVTVVEAQVDHVLAALRTARERDLDRVEVHPATERRADDELRARFAGAVWATGCGSWYLDRHGRNTTIWPGTTTSLRRRLVRFDPAAHRLDQRVRSVQLAGETSPSPGGSSTKGTATRASNPAQGVGQRTADYETGGGLAGLRHARARIGSRDVRDGHGVTPSDSGCAVARGPG